jgi:hypothetical protein
MKLHPVQKWLYKFGVPLSTLNELAQENWGYPIPDQDGKFPDWWYAEQGLPNTIRDCEVPPEILKKGQKQRHRVTMSPKVFVRVRHGRVIEIVQNGAGVQTAPDLRGQTLRAENVHTHAYGQTGCGCQRASGVNGVDTDDIVNRVLSAIGTGGPGLFRSTSVPVFPAAAPSDRDEDIMSFIHEERMPPSRRPTITEGMVNPGSLMHDASTVGQTFVHPHRSATAPVQRSVPPVRTTVGPSLPNSPRPVRSQPVQHQRNDTTYTNDTILRYYTNDADAGMHSESRDPRASYNLPPRIRDSRISMDSRAESRGSGMTFFSCAPSDAHRRGDSNFRSRLDRDYRPLDGVEEDVISVWSGYDDGDENWEDEELEFGRSEEFHRNAAERLTAYRHER